MTDNSSIEKYSLKGSKLFMLSKRCKEFLVLTIAVIASSKFISERNHKFLILNDPRLKVFEDH